MIMIKDRENKWLLQLEEPTEGKGMQKEEQFPWQEVRGTASRRQCLNWVSMAEHPGWRL